MPRTILVAVDDSDLDEAIVDHAATFARSPDDRIILLHVLEPGLSFPLDDGHTRASELQSQTEHAQELLESLAELVTGHPVDQVIETGNPAEVIRQQANELNADVIVLGSRPFSGVLGKTSEQVLHHTDRQVIVVKTAESTPVGAGPATPEPS